MRHRNTGRQLFQYNQHKGIEISLGSPEPYNRFSPFYSHPENLIPVPGIDFALADSVHGIYEALKRVKGEIDLLKLWGKPTKKEDDFTGFQYQGTIIREEDARKVIFVSTYTYHAINNALPKAHPDLIERLNTGNTVLFTDKTKNADIDNLKRPYSPAHLLSRLLSVYFEARFPIDFPEDSNEAFGHLVDATLNYLQGIGSAKRELLEWIVRYALLQSPDQNKRQFGYCMAEELLIEPQQPRVETRRSVIKAARSLVSEPEN